MGTVDRIWDYPPVDGHRPEAEWGFYLQELAARDGWRLKRRQGQRPVRLVTCPEPGKVNGPGIMPLAQHIDERQQLPAGHPTVNGLRGNKSLIDYAATKGAINAFTYSMAQNLVERGIRVNAVAPGPVWTPLIPATMPQEKVEHFGEQVPMKRAADPDEIAPSYVFFAVGRSSSYYTDEILAPIGGETLPG
jgi:NAD(P)-dependent dehydrogenase (short-subunit alcohol dehydrogenase family)